jgi:glycosyltransferase involved in cell wall biosynthesis
MTEQRQEQVFVSVIVPVYNADKYLAQCLDSLVCHQGDGYEIIAVNDGSSDTSGAILQRYCAESSIIKVIEFEKNKGVSAARNAGIEYARGDYIMFVDADDALMCGAIPLLKKMAIAYKLDLIKFSFMKIKESEETPSNSLLTNPESWIYQLTKKRDIKRAFQQFVGALLACNGFYKKEVVANIRFANCTNGEDILFGVQAFCQAKCVCQLSNELYCYRDREGSASKSYSEDHFDSVVFVCEEILKTVEASPYFTVVKELLLRKLQYRTHGLILKVLDNIKVEDKTSYWNKWFGLFDKVYCRSGLLSIRGKLLYRLLFWLHSQYAVLFFLRVPQLIKIYCIKQLLKMRNRFKMLFSWRITHVG